MSTQQEHYEEHERPGGRVRSVPDGEQQAGVQTGHPGGPGPERSGGVPDSADESREPHSDHEPDQARHAEPGAAHAGAADHAEHPVSAAADDPGRKGGAERVGLLKDVAHLRDEWQRVQGTFVDDPPRAVQEASALIERTLDEIRANVGSAHSSDTMSTEDLRVSFQRYREFFQRLLSA